MALIRCPECGKEISDSAMMCPNCGYVINGQRTNNTRQETVNKRVLLEQSGLRGGQITFMEKHWDELDDITDLKRQYNKMNTIACWCTMFGLLGGFIGWLIYVGSKPKFAGYCMVSGLIGTIAAIIVVVIVSAMTGGF